MTPILIHFSFLFIQLLFILINISHVKSFIAPEFYNTTVSGFEEFVWESIGDGRMADSYLTYDQYFDKISTIREKYPDLIYLETIGVTNDNNNLTAVKIKSRYHSNKAILFTGMHHAREPTSLMMNLYIIHKIIFLKNINYKSIRDLLDSVNIYLIPIINVDGYKVNVENYYKFNGDLSKCMIRKNRQKDPTDIFSNCVDNENFDVITPGVDLNRNYAYMFSYDDAGSSGIPCRDDYRGTGAFSEPETKAIKKFIDSHPEIKIAINYHAWGNLLITPFNYADSSESAMKLFTNYTFYKHIYDEFVEEAVFPKNFLHGNGMETIKYKANGEASDWMLGEKFILAFSPELGVDENGSSRFYLHKPLLQKVLKDNLGSALYAISRAAFYFQFNNMKKTFSNCELVKSMSYKFLDKNEDDLQDEKLCHDESYKFSLQIELKNKGFSDFKGETEFEIVIDNQIIENISIKINSGYNSLILIDNDKENEHNSNITNTNTKSFGNPNSQIIFEKNYNRSQNSYDEFKILNLDEIPTDNLNPNPLNEKIDVAKFKVLYVESFNHVLLDIKFYINKKSYAEFGKFLIDNNKLDTHTFYKIRRRNFIDNDDNDYLLKNYNLKFYSPDYKIKLKDFEYFNIKNGTLPNNNFNKYESKLRNFYKYVIIFVLIGLIILAIIFLMKLRNSDNLNHTGQEEVIEEVIDEVVSDPSNSIHKDKSGKNNYIELHNVG